MKLSTKIAYNTIVQVGGKVISTALGLITIALITRQLGAYGFGEYTTIITYLSFFAIFADLGLTLVTVQMISAKNADENGILSNLFTLRLVTAIVFLCFAPAIIYFLPYTPSVKMGALIGVLTFLFPALNQILIGVFQKYLRMDKDVLAEVVGRVVLLAGVVLGIFLGCGLYGVMLSMAASSLVNFLLHYIFSRKFVRIRLTFSPWIWKEIITRSWPLAITITFNLIYLKTDTLILSLLKSPSDVGIYGASYKIIEVASTIPFMFAGIILPILTESWSDGDARRYKHVMQRSFDVMLLFALPLIVGTQFVARDVILLVAGPEFAASGDVLRILIIATGGIFIGCMPAHGLIAVEKQKKAIPAYIFTAISSLAGYLIFIPLYSYIGAAWVTVYSETVISLILLYQAKKYSGFLPNLGMFWKIMLATTTMAAALSLLPDLNIVLTILIGAIIYGLVLFVTGGISKEMLKDLINRN